MDDPIPPALPPRRAWPAIAGMLGLVILLWVAAVMLPHDRYIRFQQLENTVMGRSRWDYERLVFDPTPIDVAVIGSSRTEVTISAPRLETILSRRIGHPIRVANLSIPQDGRDLDFVLAQQLFAHHPEVRLLLLSVNGPTFSSQPAFKYLADPGDVLRSPVFVNWSWLDNVAYLPYRQMNLFAQSLAPGLFGDSKALADAHYQGTYYDTTVPFREPNGHWQDNRVRRTATELDDMLRKSPDGQPPHVGLARRIVGMRENIVQDHFTARIAALAAGHCTKMVFVHVPRWHSSAQEVDKAANGPIAPILDAPVWMGGQAGNFTDYEHMSIRGSRTVEAWLIDALRPYYGQIAEAKPSCDRPKDEGAAR